MVLARDLLGPQVFFHGDGKVGPAFDRGIVGDNHHLGAVHHPNAGDDPSRGRRAIIHVIGRQGRKFQERRAWVKQGINALARQQLAALAVQGHSPLPSTFLHFLEPLTQAAHLLEVVRHMTFEGRAGGVNLGL